MSHNICKSAVISGVKTTGKNSDSEIISGCRTVLSAPERFKCFAVLFNVLYLLTKFFQLRLKFHYQWSNFSAAGFIPESSNFPEHFLQ